MTASTTNATATRILKLIETEPATAADIADTIGITEGMVRTYLAALKDAGEVYQLGRAVPARGKPGGRPRHVWKALRR